MPRINMAFEPDIHEWIQKSARRNGITMTNSFLPEDLQRALQKKQLADKYLKIQVPRQSTRAIPSLSPALILSDQVKSAHGIVLEHC